MRHLLTALLLLFGVSACAAQSPAEPVEPKDADAPPTEHVDSSDQSAEAWLTRIEQRAADVHSLTADLRYDNNQLLLGDHQRRFGTLVYEAGPPPRFSVHFNKKLVDGHWSQPDLYYIYDGRWLLKRDHENKTAVRYQLVPDDQEAAREMELGEGPFPIPLNLKKEKVLARYVVKVCPVVDDDPRNSVHLQLLPHEGHDTDRVLIDLWFDRDTVLPVAVSSLDDSDSQTVVCLTQTQVNPELPDATFDTALPTDPGWQTDENRIAPADHTEKTTPTKPTE